MESNCQIKTVFISIHRELKGTRSLLRGFIDYAKERCQWRIVFQEGRDSEQNIDIAKFECDAVAVDQINRKESEKLAKLRIPVILLEPLPEMTEPGAPLYGKPFVKMDSTAVGVMAAEYYLHRGYKSFAYIGDTMQMYWSSQRRDGFVRTLGKAGFDCKIYDGPFSATVREEWNIERPQMIRFLNSLPKPTAVFAAMDFRAMLVIDACAHADLRIPEDIAVLGVDDDQLICDACCPSLSSIRTGGYRRGWLAARLLDDLFKGRKVPQDSIVKEPLAVMTRASTGYDAMRNPFLSRAIRFCIANAAKKKCTVAEVAAVAGCSRRYLENLFRKMVGMSVRDMIMNEKIERAKSLLEKEVIPIGDIPEECGILCNSHLAVLFKKATGMSMRDWRRLHRDAPSE